MSLECTCKAESCCGCEDHVLGCPRWLRPGRRYPEPEKNVLPDEALPEAKDYTEALAKIDRLLALNAEQRQQLRRLRVRYAIRHRPE